MERSIFFKLQALNKIMSRFLINFDYGKIECFDTAMISLKFQDMRAIYTCLHAISGLVVFNRLSAQEVRRSLEGKQ